MPKNWCFWTVVLEKALESPLDYKEDKQVNPKGDQPWIFIGKIAKAEVPVLWPPDVKSQLIGKDPDAGKDWGQEEKGVTEGEMVGWHHRLEGHEFEQTLGDSEGQGWLAGCSPWGCKEWRHYLVTNNNNNNYHLWSPYQVSGKRCDALCRVSHSIISTRQYCNCAHLTGKRK